MKPIKNVKGDGKKVKLSKSKKSTRKTVNPKKRSSEPIDDIEDTSAVIAKEEDEEIDEDEAFNSEDERKWGAVFPRSKSKTILEDAEEDDEEDLGISFQSRRKTHKNDIKDDDEDEEEKEEEEEDIGLTLEDMLDASLAADAAKKGIKKKNASKNQQEESTSNKKMKTKILARTIKRKREPTEHVDEEDEEEEEEEEEENADDEFLSDDQRKRIFELLKSTSSSSSSLSTVKEMSLKRKKTNRGSREGGHIAESGGFGPEGEFAAAQVQAIKAAKGLLKEAKDSQGIENESGVDIGGLVSALSGTAGYTSLKSKLERLVGKSLDSDSLLPVAPVPLKAPPTKEISDKATRVESYDHVSRLVGNRWTDLVSLTRQAPSISFSAEAGVDTRKTQTTASMAASFTPSNEFEVKIAAALAASGMGALPGQAVIGALSSSTRGRKGKGRGNTAATGDKAVLEAEQGELAELQSRLGGDDDDENGDDDDDDDDHLEGDFEGDDLKEAPANAAALKARQRTLQRMRALLFFDEIKKRRINKVKSKTFRRLRKKADTKAGAIEIERLQDEDPEAARALEDAEARIIAKERASLKHRSSGRGVGGSKWIKRVLARGGGGGNSESHLHNKAELIALQQREEALRAKIRGIKASTNDEEEDDDEEDDNDNDDDDDDGSMSAADILAQGRASILKIATEAEDGTSKPRKGLFGMRFMSQAVDRAKAAAKDAGELEAASMARHEDILRSDSGVGRGNSALGGWSLDDYEDDDALQEEDAAIAQDEERNDDNFSSGNVASEEGHIDNKPESALSILRKTRAATKAKLEADSAKVASGSTVGRFTFQGKSSKNGNLQNKINDDEEEENENEEDRPTSGLSKHATQKAMAEVRAIAAATSSSTSNSTSKPKLIKSSNTKSSTSLSSLTSSTDAAAVSENPWLAASFSSGLGERHNASKRATQAALEASKSLKNSNSAVIDVASAISAIQADADANTLKKAKAKKKVSYELLNSNEQSFLQASSSSSITSTKKRSLSTSVVNQQDSDGVLRDTKRVKKEKFMKKDNQNDNDNDDDNDDNDNDDDDDDERERGKGLRSNMDQATLVRAAFVDAGADMNADDSIEAEKLREERERIEDNVAANKRGKGRAGRDKDTSSASAGWGSWTGLGASVAIETKTNGEKHNPSRVTLSASASAILASKKSDLLRIEQERESETPSQKAARIEVQRRKDAGLTGVFISEKRDKKLAQSHQAPTVPHPFPNKEAYEASMRHPLGREWNTMAATAAFTKPEWTTKAGLIIQPIRPANIKRDGKGPEEARKHVPSIGNIGQGKKSSKHR